MTIFVNCPNCGAKVAWMPENKSRPFCSERCKKIDLGAWAEEKYIIPESEPQNTEEDSI